MSETYTPPETESTNQTPAEDPFAVLDEWQEDAAKRAKSIIDAPTATPIEPEDKKDGSHKGVIAATSFVAGAALFLGGGLIAQTVSNEAQHNDRVAAVTAEYEHNQSILTEIQTEALAPIDPASIIGVFNVTEGQTINSLSINIVNSQAEYQNADEATKDWIDYTILESGKAQGVYHIGEMYVVSHATIDGKDTLIVQDGNEIPQE